MKLFLIPLPLSFFLFIFLAVDTGPSYSGEILSLLESLRVTSIEGKILFFSFYTVRDGKESSLTFHFWNAQSVNVTLRIAHSIQS